MLKYIRFDDISFDLDVDLFRSCCELCDKYGYHIIQCITFFGKCIPIDSRMTNDEIVAIGGNNMIIDNVPLCEAIFARNRKDYYAVHGLFHTHEPRIEEIKIATALIERYFDVSCDYFCAPFNQYPDVEHIAGLRVLSINCDRLESYHDNGTIPKTEIAYIHPFRYSGSPYILTQLEDFFKYMKANGN